MTVNLTLNVITLPAPFEVYTICTTETSTKQVPAVCQPRVWTRPNLDEVWVRVLGTCMQCAESMMKVPPEDDAKQCGK
jgi:hypothetical protein